MASFVWLGALLSFCEQDSMQRDYLRSNLLLALIVIPHYLTLGKQREKAALPEHYCALLEHFTQRLALGLRNQHIEKTYETSPHHHLPSLLHHRASLPSTSLHHSCNKPLSGISAECLLAMTLRETHAQRSHDSYQ